MLLFSATRTYGAKFCERRRINLHVQNKSYVIGQKNLAVGILMSHGRISLLSIKRLRV